MYFVGVIISIHTFACLYLFIAAMEINKGTQCTWLSTPSSACPTATGLITASEYERYVTALLWSVGSMCSDGYAVAAPITDAEQILTSTWFLGGQLYFVFLVAMLTSILALNDVNYTRFQSKLRSVGAYLRYKRVPEGLQERAVDFYLYAWEQRQTYPFLDHDLLDDLSASIRRDIIAYVIKPLLDEVEIFQNCNIHFLRKLMYRMKPLILVPQDLLTLEGDMATSMFFITKGSVEVTRKGDPICILSENEHFGELSLFLPIRRNVSVRALTHCDVYTLRQDDVKQVLADYPDEYHKILHRVHEQIQSPDAHQQII
jgi:CRP-like cAMP-binding protein